MILHQNTIYVATQGAYLSRRGETIAVRVGDEIRARIPIHHVASIVCFGRVGCSPALMAFCTGHGVGISYLTPTGRFLARVEGHRAGNVLLRRAQFRAADDESKSREIARSVVIGKLLNCRSVLMRAVRDYPGARGAQELEVAAKRLAGIAKAIPPDQSLELIRGMEGDGARTYFGVFNHLLRTTDDEMRFQRRTRRPPLDRANSVLSFLYTLLTHDVRSAIEAVGLDPAVGFLHRDRPGRFGLALDLMEEWRPVLADRVALSLINRAQIRPDGFVQTETGEIRMTDETRSTVLAAWQERKREEITHPFVGERMPFMLAMQMQARLLARFLRGDLEGYPPFVWR